MITHELGHAGRNDFRQMLAGKQIELAYGTLGACLRRITRLLRRFGSGVSVGARSKHAGQCLHELTNR
jgi:hypothetical protein